MADISKKRQHALEADEVEVRIERIAMGLVERIGGEWRWEDGDAVYEGRGARARVEYTAETIMMKVKLPLMLKPMRGRIASVIDEVFDEHFGPKAA